MSRIAGVEPFWLRRPPDSRSPRAEEIFLLRLTTEDGLSGWGEAHGSPFLLHAAVLAPVTHVSAQGLIHLLIGADATDIPALRHRLDRGTQWIGRDGTVAQAIAAAELALWDLAGQRAGIPVARLLSPRPAASSVRCYASGKVAATPQQTHDRVLAERRQGFSGAKIGWPPFGATLDGDCAYLEAARDAAGPDMALMLDAAQAWDTATALDRLESFARFNLGWIEEPIDRDCLDGYATLRSAGKTPIAAGEGECTLRGLRALVDQHCVDIIQPDITRAGLLAAWEVARMARQHGIGVASHSFTSALNVTAHAHLLAALGDPDAWLEWPVAPLAIWRDVFPDAPQPVAGRLTVPTAPGWGLRPDPAALALHVQNQPLASFGA